MISAVTALAYAPIIKLIVVLMFFISGNQLETITTLDDVLVATNGLDRFPLVTVCNVFHFNIMISFGAGV